MSKAQESNAPYNDVFNDFTSLKLEDKAKFLLQATFSTVFGAFEELVDLASETYVNVADERKETAQQKKKASTSKTKRKSTGTKSKSATK